MTLLLRTGGTTRITKRILCQLFWVMTSSVYGGHFVLTTKAENRRAPEREKAKGKLKNYKLKHSRLLTCYSALLYLLAVYRMKKTVSPADAKLMISLTPTERLEWLLRQTDLSEAHPSIVSLLRQYEIFLDKELTPGGGPMS